MPLFMDRHEITQSWSLEEIAAMHDLDVSISPRFGVRWLTYYLDPVLIASPSSRVIVKTAFCIAEAANRDMVVACHGASHGLVPSDIHEVDRQTVEQYLGSIHVPGPAEPWEEPALRTILVAEPAHPGSMASAGASTGALASFKRLAGEAITAAGGRPIDRPGPAVMASFVSPAMAVECATSLHQSVAEHSAAHPQDALQVRTGLSAGQPQIEAEGLFTSAAQTAEAICAASDPGTILVSGVLRELCAGMAMDFVERGWQVLPGLKDPVRLYSVGTAPAPPGGRPRGHRLSDREVEVIRLIAAGRSNQQIADQLVISLSTVVRHVANIFDKTAVRNRTEAAAYAFHNGLA